MYYEIYQNIVVLLLQSIYELHFQNKIIENLESKGSEDFAQEYQELIKLNNFIEKKFQQEIKLISKKTKDKIDEIVINGKKTKKTVQKSK